jgi:hypothetical protein
MKKFVLFGVVSLMILCLFALPVLAFEVEQVTDDPAYSDQPDGVFDPAGNAHVVWSDDRDGVWEIYYKVVDADSNILIDDTRITSDDSAKSSRPRVALDSTGRLFVVWQDSENGTTLPYLMRVEPTLDDMDGGAATAASIVTLGPTMISDVSDSNDEHHTPFIAIDGTDNLHIVWDAYAADEIKYSKLDGDGAELVAEKVLNPGSGGSWQRATPDLALDSSGNVHITWADEGFDTDMQIYYAMLSGTSGSTMIAATRLTDDDGTRSWYPTINVDGDDMAYLVLMAGIPYNWKPVDTLDHPEIYFMKIDPSLDDMDGSAAVADSIMVIADKELTPRDRITNMRPYSRLIGSTLIVSHYEWDGIDTYANNLDIMWVSTSSGSVLKETRLSTTAEAYNDHWNHARMARTGSSTFAVLWSDSQWGGSTNLTATDLSTSTGGGGGGGGGGCNTIGPVGGNLLYDALGLFVVGLVLMRIRRRYLRR